MTVDELLTSNALTDTNAVHLQPNYSILKIPPEHTNTTAKSTSTAFHVMTFFGGNCDLTFLLLIPRLFQRILSSARNSGVLFIQCMIIIVSVCLSLAKTGMLHILVHEFLYQ